MPKIFSKTLTVCGKTYEMFQRHFDELDGRYLLSYGGTCLNYLFSPDMDEEAVDYVATELIMLIEHPEFFVEKLTDMIVSRFQLCKMPVTPLQVTANVKIDTFKRLSSVRVSEVWAVNGTYKLFNAEKYASMLFDYGCTAYDGVHEEHGLFTYPTLPKIDIKLKVAGNSNDFVYEHTARFDPLNEDELVDDITSQLHAAICEALVIGGESRGV